MLVIIFDGIRARLPVSVGCAPTTFNEKGIHSHWSVPLRLIRPCTIGRGYIS
jgi:hypothetical protein